MTDELNVAVDKFLEHYRFSNETEPSKLPAPYFAIYHEMLPFDNKDQSEKNIDDLGIRPLRYANRQTVSRLQRRGEWIWKCRVRCMVSYGDDVDREFQSSEQERYMIDMMMYPDNPPDDQFIYLTPRTIKGFTLKRKKWVDLQVDRFQEPVWNTRAFDGLVIDKKTKRMIQALISNQIEAERSTDLISGKGNGLILLLHGGPGTGKTLTAESVAEIAQKPLYPVTCGDIGTEPEAVETYLESVLHIGKTWGCVVLLDEADIFLEQRSLEDLRRNALVSVFLRVLEYYDGILVLTSNRVGTFDEAFESRIQLAVHYHNLSLDQRTQIWRNFIGRLEELKEEGIDFDDLHDNVTKLASHKMNGREIRNVITTARQYARWERKQLNQQGYKLDYKVMEEVLRTARKFDEYIRDMNAGFTNDQLAAQDGLRRAGGV
ncbi:P-loop containing nucleoside triphosphate hydrolase protein [Hypoxylon sp. NC1633]|nr:P-loop containing nucleoside triphosphate hydrolase protein [Hypoxylon sp. NC1633]